MNNAIFDYQLPCNEPVRSYAPGSEEMNLLSAELKRQASTVIEIPLIIGGKEVKTGVMSTVVMPTNHKHVLANYHMATEETVKMACEAAMEAKKIWSNMPWEERTSIMNKAAELLAKKYRYVINAATMLGQGKNPFQAEIDAACEAIDFLRFNSYYAAQIYKEQPISTPDATNRLEYRPLEGFVYAISPFNFTSIGMNLNTSAVVMGNTTVWKPATTAILSNYYMMMILKEAGLPDGVINFVPGKGSIISSVVLNHKDFAGIHFTGSNRTFNSLWRDVANNLEKYKSYPRIVGETGGKDFIFALPTADATEVTTAIIRGAFEYQGQKCSAASRSYLPKSLWAKIKPELVAMHAKLKMGDVMDSSNFINAVIDKNSYDTIMGYIAKAKDASDAEIIAGGKGDDSVGYFVEPTIIVTSNPRFVTMEEEIFGPVMTIYVYEDKDVDAALKLCDETSPYALTGAIFSRDKAALLKASEVLKYAAGNMYYNDKPTGAVVGQQPFGGARASGTNDKAGSHLNLLRWVSPRTIKETMLPATDYWYPFLGK